MKESGGGGVSSSASQALHECDIDSDGYVTRAELILALKQCGVAQPEKSDTDIILAAFDRSGSGLVNIAALAHAFKLCADKAVESRTAPNSASGGRINSARLLEVIRTKLLDKLSFVSGAGLVIYGLTVTFAMVDWTMSVNPHWYSTIWGMLYVGGQGLSAFAFGIVVLVLLAQVPPLDRVITAHHLHDLGKLMFAFLMLWAYLSFSQFLIIWSANLPEEIPHYLVRWDNNWKYLSLFIIVGHFIVPYALLLSRDLKRNSGKLRLIATWIIVARLADYYWHVAPEFHRDGFSFSLLDIAVPLALGGVFISLFVAQLRGRSLLPVNDPGLEKALTHHVH